MSGKVFDTPFRQTLTSIISWQCDLCGCLVEDTATHTAYHETLRSVVESLAALAARKS